MQTSYHHENFLDIYCTNLSFECTLTEHTGLSGISMNLDESDKDLYVEDFDEKAFITLAIHMFT